MANIEYKAELLDLELARAQCRALGAQHVEIIQQVDTYFRTTNGRLKRRTVAGRPVQWISYERANEPSPRVSHYTILNEEQARMRWGEFDLPEWLTVTKTREHWQHDNARIHLDEVDHLGRFVEFEAVIDEQHDEQSCRALIESLRETFAPILGEAVPQSYSDMLQASASAQSDQM